MKMKVITTCVNNNESVQPRFQPRVRSVENGTGSVRFKGPKLWQMLPQTIRNSGFLAQFSKCNRLEGRKLSMQAVSHFYSELELFMIFLEICLLYSLMNCR